MRRMGSQLVGVAVQALHDSYVIWWRTDLEPFPVAQNDRWGGEGIFDEDATLFVYGSLIDEKRREEVIDAYPDGILSRAPRPEDVVFRTSGTSGRFMQIAYSARAALPASASSPACRTTGRSGSTNAAFVTASAASEGPCRLRTRVARWPISVTANQPTQATGQVSFRIRSITFGRILVVIAIYTTI